MTLESVNPTVKLVVVLTSAIALTAIDSVRGNAVVIVLAIGWVLVGSSAGTASIVRFILPALWISAGTFVTGLLFARPDEDGSATGLFLASRVVAFASLGGMFSITTGPQQLVRSLQQQARLSPLFAYGMVTALNLLPRVREQYEECCRAMRVRGLQVGPFARTPIRNTLVNTIRWSEHLSMAMESRGFDANAPRTVRDEIPVRRADGVFAFVWITIIATAMWLG